MMSPSSPPTAFVTGANGRVGIHLVRLLIAEGHDVVGLARSEDKARGVRDAGARCLVGDLDDADVLDEGLDGASIVYHLAGGMRGPGRITADHVNHQG